MNQPRNQRSSGRRTPNRRPAKPADVWRTPPSAPDVEPIVVPDVVGGLLHSLGDPPTAGGELLARYFTAVIERTAAIATAIALSADVLATSPDDAAEPPFR